MKGKYLIIKKGDEIFIAAYNMKLVSNQFEIPYSSLQRSIAANNKYIGKFGIQVFVFESKENIVSVNQLKNLFKNQLSK